MLWFKTAVFVMKVNKNLVSYLEIGNSFSDLGLHLFKSKSRVQASVIRIPSCRTTFLTYDLIYFFAGFQATPVTIIMTTISQSRSF